MFGTPLLDDGAQVVAPALRVTPRDARAAQGDLSQWHRHAPPTAGYQEQVYFLKLATDAKAVAEAARRERWRIAQELVKDGAQGMSGAKAPAPGRETPARALIGCARTGNVGA